MRVYIRFWNRSYFETVYAITRVIESPTKGTLTYCHWWWLK